MRSRLSAERLLLGFLRQSRMSERHRGGNMLRASISLKMSFRPCRSPSQVLRIQQMPLELPQCLAGTKQLSNSTANAMELLFLA